MLYKMDLLCVDEALYSVVNIRINLWSHQFKKRHRKLLRKNADRFEVSVGPAVLDAERERLYQLQKPRFKGFIHGTLAEYLSAEHAAGIFNTQELSVRADGQLVAVSYFDLGETAMASLLGLYDPEFADASLGTYTMLKEMEFGQAHGYKWFYPGYVLDRPSPFDYKLKLGEIEYYKSTKRWAKFSSYSRSQTSAAIMERAMEHFESALASEGIAFRRWLYPFFTLGHLPFMRVDFFDLPVFLEIGHDHDGMLVVGHSVESGGLVLAHLLPCPNEFPHSVLDLADEYNNIDVYYAALMKYGDAHGDTFELSEAISFIHNWNAQPDAITSLNA